MTIDDIRKLREETGVGVMDARKALEESKGDIKKATELQSTLISSNDSHLREMGLVSLGRLYEKSNDKTKALEIYNKIISDFPESSNLSLIKEKIERLKG